VLAPGYEVARRSRRGREEKYPREVTHTGDVGSIFKIFKGLGDGSWMADDVIDPSDLEEFVSVLSGKTRVIPFGKLGNVLRLFKLKLECPVCGKRTFEGAFFNEQLHREVWDENEQYWKVEDRAPPREQTQQDDEPSQPKGGVNRRVGRVRFSTDDVGMAAD
jgi:hypothetical protein